jgi:hypothetical protein
MYQRNVIVRLLTAAVFVLLIGATPHGNAEIPRRLEILFLGTIVNTTILKNWRMYLQGNILKQV